MLVARHYLLDQRVATQVDVGQVHGSSVAAKGRVSCSKLSIRVCAPALHLVFVSDGTAEFFRAFHVLGRASGAQVHRGQVVAPFSWVVPNFECSGAYAELSVLIRAPAVDLVVVRAYHARMLFPTLKHRRLAARGKLQGLQVARDVTCGLAKVYLCQGTLYTKSFVAPAHDILVRGVSQVLETDADGISSDDHDVQELIVPGPERDGCDGTRGFNNHCS
mmetsp:Transcript_1568/g.5370  ORF Transcript_1568/g.5370 Transcript_1568/m.5370 type:complete len:219 (+) Transcript_1568:175-831(+)